MCCILFYSINFLHFILNESFELLNHSRGIYNIDDLSLILNDYLIYGGERERERKRETETERETERERERERERICTNKSESESL